MGDDNQSFDFNSAVQILLLFVLNLVVSLLIGTFCGLLSSFFFKKCRFMYHSTVGQVTTVFLFGFLAYVILEWLNFSGVIGVLVAGIVMGHYTIYNLSLSGQLTTCITFQTFSQLAESFLFVYLGFVFWGYIPSGSSEYTWSWLFILMEIAICLIARFLSIFVLSALVFIFKRRTWNVDPAELAIVWFAGAIRGSVAFALILTIEAGSGKVDPQVVQLLRTSVLAIVFITTILGGGAMPGYIKFMLARSKNNINPIESTIQPLMGSENKIYKKPGVFKMLDEEYLKPFLIFEYEQNKDKIKLFKRNLKMNSPDFRGGSFLNKFDAALK